MARKDERCPVVSTAAVPGLLPVSANHEPRQPEWAKEVILYGAQSIPVGRVFVWNDEENLYVRCLLNEIAVDEGWNLSETLIFVDTSSDLSGFWRHHMPGQLNHQEAQEPVSEFTEIISLDGWEPGEDLSITVNGAMAIEDVDEDPRGDGVIFTLQCALSTHFTYRLVKKPAPTELSCFLFDRKTGTILDYDTTGGLEVVIPSEIGGVTVEHVGDLSFLDKGLTSVMIPDTIRSIGEGAFAFNRLTRVIIPDSVTTIGDAAFYSNQLTGVIIPDSVTAVSDLTFAENDLSSMVMGKRVPLEPGHQPPAPLCQWKGGLLYKRVRS